MAPLSEYVWAHCPKGEKRWVLTLQFTPAGNVPSPNAPLKRVLAYTGCFSRMATIKDIHLYLSQRLRIKEEDMRLWLYNSEVCSRGAAVVRLLWGRGLRVLFVRWLRGWWHPRLTEPNPSWLAERPMRFWKWRGLAVVLLVGLSLNRDKGMENFPYPS